MSYLVPWQRSVYLLGDGFLFDEIITHMLTSDSNVRVIRRVYEDQTAFQTDVSWLQPDVIVLIETDRLNCHALLALLSDVSLIADVRVIAMSLKSNLIKIVDQPADPVDSWAGAAYTLKQVVDWNDVFDLVGGRQLVWNQ